MPAAAVENPDEAESVEQWNTLGLGNLVTIISASLILHALADEKQSDAVSSFAVPGLWRDVWLPKVGGIRDIWRQLLTSKVMIPVALSPVSSQEWPDRC